MNILYGVCGLGNGHVSRSYPIIKKLSKKHDITVLGHDNSASFFKKKGYNVLEYDYIHLNIKQNRLANRQVFLSTLQDFPNLMKSFVPLLTKIRKQKIDFVISDFEWFSLAVSKYLNLPNLVISNYHLIDCFSFQKPFYYYIREIPLLSYFKINADKIIIPWQKNLVKNPNSYIFAGIEQIQSKAKVKKGKSFFGYFPDGVPSFYKGEYIEKGMPHSLFLKKIAESKAYFCHGGFSSIIEALNFGKPLGIVATEGFFEREHNAEMMQFLKFGRKISSKKDYTLFEKKCSEYSKNIKKKVKPIKNALYLSVKNNLA